MAEPYIFEGDEIVDLRSIRDKMREILTMSKSKARTTRASAFADGYRAADSNANGNMGQAAGYLGDRYREACLLFEVEHPVFGEEDPRDAGERLMAEDEANR